MSDVAFYNWKAKHTVRTLSELKRLKSLEDWKPTIGCFLLWIRPAL